jgi:rhodanese-related sulfurtransferase
VRRTVRSQGIHLLVLAITACLPLAACSEASTSSDVSQAQVLEWIDEGSAPLILDVRTPAEFAQGHVPGAVNISHHVLGDQLGQLGADHDAPIVVYCERGGRALRAQETLRAAGYKDVRHLEGDMQGWRASGLQVE